jgi:hypothetical protein
MAGVEGVGVEQEVDVISSSREIEGEWNGQMVVHLHQPNFLFLNVENVKFDDQSKNLKLRVSRIPDAELMQRIQELLEMQGFGDAKVHFVNDPVAVKV